MCAHTRARGPPPPLAAQEIGGWDLATLQSPPAVHLALTLPTSRNADKFISDLRLAVAAVRADTVGKYAEGTAGIYGMAASMPAGFVEESAKVFLDLFTAVPGVDAPEGKGSKGGAVCNGT